MASKHPINEDIIKNDFGINKIGYINRILVNLSFGSENYIKSLKKVDLKDKSYKSNVYDSSPYIKACDECLVF